jgi:hypothetical protein
MLYTKPELTPLRGALDAIQGIGKTASVEDSAARPATCSAYEADE